MVADDINRITEWLEDETGDISAPMDCISRVVDVLECIRWLSQHGEF